VGNGLGSPLCHNRGEAELSTAATRNCRTSGFEAAQAPTGNYAFDVHINTGLLGANSDTLEQDYLISPVWMALVWIGHALIVALEWCYTIDLLNSSAMSSVARGLRAAQATFTQPWLVMALAVASVLALYNGLIRRRVAETLGQAMLMGAMMVGGLWVIANPTGTVGALGQWANQASLGTLGAVTEGTPAHPARTLADSMRGLFNGVVAGPWCYMEFGDVEWCSNPARLDPRLRASGMVTAALERSQIGCGISNGSVSLGGLTVCVAPGSPQVKVLNQSAELLRGARTNGELFLALPANQAARNSINDSGSLFNVLCGGNEEPCRGPTAAQAEFRTRSGTQARLGGLFLITIGALGMILLLGFIALHLLSAAIISLFYLLLAPAAVIAPALGDGGRAAFRGWAARLLGAVIAKLIYSFLLGVVLIMGRILMSLGALGWWTQWLLVTVLWWGAFRHRHQVLSFTHGDGGSRGQSVGGLRLASRLMPARELGRAGRMARRKLSPYAPSVEQRRKRAQVGLERAKAGTDEQAQRMLEREHRDASATVQAAPEIQERLSGKRAQLERVRSQRGEALTRGEERRAAKLGHRAQRIEGEIASEQQALNMARQVVKAGEKAQGATGKTHTREQVEKSNRFLDAQAALPSSVRDYAGSAGIAGYSRKQFEGLDGRGKRGARLEIDRELALRKELNATAKDVAVGGQGKLGPRDRSRISQHRMDRQFDSTLQERMGEGGYMMPSSRETRSKLDTWLQDGRAERRSPPVRESSVMRDAREVAMRRKRQLGKGRR
jgi:hypothetical protein